MTTRRHILSAGAAALAGTLLPTAGSAQTLQRNARLIVGFPPGGSTDIVARLLAERLRGNYAPQIIVENRPGAGGRVAADVTKAAEPDGTTMLLTPASILALYPHVYRRLGYDAFADFAPVTKLCSFPFGFTVGPAVPATVRNLADFVQWARAQGKPIAYGSPGAGSMPHFTGFTIGRALGFPVTHVPYKGGAPAIQDLLGGQIPASVNVIAEPLPHYQAGKLRILAQTGAQRSSFVPDVPTFAESGYRDIVAREWFGMFVPARTPAPTITALNAALREAIRSKEVGEGYGRFAFDPEGDSPADFGRDLRAMYDQWGPIIKASGFTSDD
ncbi:MAG: Bug family tripartite tricarboxylate transporter substrate binding protein [Burkholderiales bacterium]|nr:Bug family tripartite tricarboxylate transporter substrate binding protein [Burkholderiales bacterium]